MTKVFPDTELRSGRLLLRPFTAADVRDTQASCADELTQRWLPLPQPYTLDNAEAWCTRVAHTLRDKGDGIHFAITDLAGGRLLGTVGLKKTDWRAQTSEVGYWISPWARGSGVAAEATGVVAQWLLVEQGFERLELRSAVENVASCKTAVRAGFQHEGVLRNASFVHSGRIDVAVFSRIRGDLDAAPDPSDSEAAYVSAAAAQPVGNGG